MEGIEPVNYDRVLGLSARGFTTVVACAAGYRDEADKYATRHSQKSDSPSQKS